MALRNDLMRAEFAGLTDQQALDRLLEIVETGRVTSQQTLAAAASVLTDEEQEQVSATLSSAAAQSPAMADYRGLLLGPGLDWSQERFRGKLDLLAVAGSWSAETLNKLKQIGIQTAPQWQAWGQSAEPSLQDVTDARASIAAAEVTEWVRVRCNEVLTAIDAGSVLTIEAAKAALGAA